MRPIRVLTYYQKGFIEDNYKTMTYEKMAKHLGLKRTWLENYCSKNRMRKQIQKRGEKKEESYFFNVNQRWAWL